jgi:heat shock protein HtpX
MFLLRKKYPYMLFTQMCATTIIAMNILVMKCTMFQLIWVYIGVVLIGTLLIALGRYYVLIQSSDTIPNPRYISKFSSIFQVPIKVLNTSRIKAFVCAKTVFLSVGLLEILERNEIAAVIAHEAYHAKNSPNKIYASFFALTSLTFIQWSDELDADRYAANCVGAASLSGALRKLEIKNWEKRIGRL